MLGWLTVMLARLAGVCLVLLMTAPRARAQGGDGKGNGDTAQPAGTAATDESEAQAREHFRAAEIDFNLGKFTEALASYQAAYQAKPLPAFMFNIAQCYRNMGKYERARFFYRRYLTLEPKSPNRRVVTDLIAEVTRLMKNPPPTPSAPVQAPGPAERS